MRFMRISRADTMPCRSLGKCASSGTIPVLMLKFLPLNLEKDVALLAYYSMALPSSEVVAPVPRPDSNLFAKLAPSSIIPLPRSPRSSSVPKARSCSNSRTQAGVVSFYRGSRSLGARGRFANSARAKSHSRRLPSRVATSRMRRGSPPKQ